MEGVAVLVHELASRLKLPFGVVRRKQIALWRFDCEECVFFLTFIRTSISLGRRTPVDVRDGAQLELDAPLIDMNIMMVEPTRNNFRLKQPWTGECPGQAKNP